MENVPKIESVFIEDELQKSYLAYSMSMITARALPDVRDGLKPVHRRVLYGMHDLSLTASRAPKKCARVVGDVIGKYHPHGDSAVYDTLVRMAQDFSLRYIMVQGQGNFGSIDGDPPAAMRYTECRMSRLAEEMLADLDKETVDFAPNYDDTMQEPAVLPAKVPFLLVNGSTGIAVGMATNMAPHNLGEVVDAINAVIDNSEIDFAELVKIIPGPDFPTGGTIFGRQGILEAYKTGRGKVVIRATSHVETKEKDREHIIITEIPYMVNKSTLLERIADLVRNKVIEGISLIRDESDRHGMRIVIGLKKDAYSEVVLSKLYKYTPLQSTFGINNLALVKGQPRQLGLREIIDHFIEHRHDVIVRRTTYELNKARQRAHILEGLRIALEHIDEIVELIKKSSSPEEAQASLIERFTLSEVQAKAILEMRLQRLTGLERDKIEEEYQQLVVLITDLTDILERKERRMQIMRDELTELQQKYADPRRTAIVDSTSDVDIEDMIADEDMVITMSHQGYIKRMPVTTYRSQGRGGRGVKGMESKDGDFIQSLFIASAHTYILFFTTIGRCHWLKVYKIPEASRQGRGRPIVNLLSLREGEQVAAYVPVRDFDEGKCIFAATAKGVINKQPLVAYKNVRRDGINAFKLDDDDRIVAVNVTDSTKEIILGTRNGLALRFNDSAMRELGRNTRGVRGIKLRFHDELVGMVVVDPEDKILTVTEKGYGKRTQVEEYRVTNRGGVGIKNIKMTERTGSVVGIMGLKGGEDVMLITRNGIIIRSDTDAISVIGRNTQGVKLINLAESDQVIDIALCEKVEELSEISPDETQVEQGDSNSSEAEPGESDDSKES